METTTHPLSKKSCVAWIGVCVSNILSALGITTWGDVAALATAVYSSLLILDWIYKKWQLYKLEPRNGSSTVQDNTEQR